MTVIWIRALKRRIERDIERGIPFMRAMSSLANARLILQEQGYTPSVHRQGWELLVDLMSSRPPWDVLKQAPVKTRAIEELTRWTEEKVGLLRSLVTTHYSEPTDFFFSNFELFEQGPSLAVKLLLDSYDRLKSGTAPDREASRDKDLAFIELLEARHILNDEIEARLRALEEKAHDLNPIEIPEDMLIDDEAYLEKADKLHAWLKFWREAARSGPHLH